MNKDVLNYNIFIAVESANTDNIIAVLNNERIISTCYYGAKCIKKLLK